MKALFNKGIVHRDLKPQNILLAHSGTKQHPQPSEIRLKIADFGFARFLQDGVMAATLCGSPMYMAPEVIMSLQYDAKADLWSLGTIVFQCLTGKAPFQANTPQQLKMYYEKNANLAPKIPSGTSPELCELLNGLLKRNARERMNFETFFNHRFLQRPEPTPIPTADLPINAIYGSPPILSRLPGRVPTPVKIITPPSSQPESPRLPRTALSSSPEDDFVLVPANLPSDQSTDSYAEKPVTYKTSNRTTTHQCHSPPATAVASNSPPRPSYLPVSATDPIPVPTQRHLYERIHSGSEKSRPATMTVAASPPKNNSIPRSQPISMKRSENRHHDIDISSLSPPSVQFVIGTPPGGGITIPRRRTSSTSSICETPPPPSIWQVSPVSKAIPQNSPLKINGTPPPMMSGQLARVPMLSSPNLVADNNNIRTSPIMPFGTRAVTLPEISEMGNLPILFGTAPDMTNMGSVGGSGGPNANVGFFGEDMFAFESQQPQPPIEFHPPELPEETLLQREHNETLAKINFVLTLSNCVLELAAARAAPLGALLEGPRPREPVTVPLIDSSGGGSGSGGEFDSTGNPLGGVNVNGSGGAIGVGSGAVPAAATTQAQQELGRRAEQLILLVRALQLLSSGLSLATQQLKNGTLRPSANVKNVVSMLNAKFRSTLVECKQLNSTGLLSKVAASPITADKILYNHAIQICQSAALDELFGNPSECFQRYQTAQILLHSLSQQIHNMEDRALLTKYKEAVEKRLFLLQKQGYIYTTDLN